MIANKSRAYASPKLEIRKINRKGGHGVFAIEPIAAGELLVICSGNIYHSDDLSKLPEEFPNHGIQVEENLYLIPPTIGELSDFINHSCAPNTGLEGQIVLRAMHAIAPGEEICYDYAMSDGSSYDEFICECGSLACRRRITGDDWQLTELQVRYHGWFSPYLQRRIDGRRQCASEMESPRLDNPESKNLNSEERQVSEAN